MYFHIGNTTGGKPSWWLYSENHKQVAWAGETFDSTWNARRAAQAFKDGARTARYEIYLDTGERYRWRAWRSSDKVASSGEAFADKASATRAEENVRDNAGGASL